MYRGIPTERSCARAWVAAATALIKDNDEGYNFVIDVEDPWNHDDSENAVITLVDKFLRERDENPVITIANTIFPQAQYEAHGSPNFYKVEHDDFDRLTDTKRWGRFFERITRHRKAEGETYNPLQNMIGKMSRQEEAGVHYKAAYEVAMYDPLRDGRSLYGTLPCLSF